jgi:hypothetical protein
MHGEDQCVTGLSVFANFHLWKSGFYLPTRDWEIVTLPLFMIVFQRGGSQVPEKDILDV